MSLHRHLGTLGLAFAIIFILAGCSHAIFSTNGGGGGGNSTSPMILTLHDAAPSGPPGVTVTAFEVSITGAVLQPGNVSLLSSPQTVELTQLQTNSVYLSTTKIASGSYTSPTLTYANAKYTFVNNSGASVTVNGQACAVNATCVVSSPKIDQMTGTASLSPSVVVGQNNQTLIEADINLNDLIQSDFSLDFSKSAAATVSQDTDTNGGTAAIGSPIGVSGQVGTITASSEQFQLTAATGQTFTVTATSGTTFEFGRANCAANDFQCIATGQIVDVDLAIIANGTTFEASEVDFDDAAGTQQVSGTIVAQNGTPPTSVTMVVHNTIPPVASLPPGTPVTVNIPNTAAFVVNNGSFVLPTGLSFASPSDILVGQEMEARVASNSSISNGAFTTDRLALEQTQLEASVSSVDSQVQPYPYFVLSPLPALFSAAPVNATQQLDIVDTSSNGAQGTLYENLTPDNIGGLTGGQAQLVTVGGFLFHTTVPPSIIATVVRGEVPGT